MSKGLEELKEIELKWQYGVFTFIPNFELIEKELKALEIVKKKRVDTAELVVSCDLKTYNHLFRLVKRWQLTQKEYDLLKEVLL